MGEEAYTLVQKYPISGLEDWQWLALPLIRNSLPRFRLVWPTEPKMGQRCELLYTMQKNYFLCVRDRLRNGNEPEVATLSDIKPTNRVYYFRWPLENVLLNLDLIIPEAEAETEWAIRAINKKIQLAQTPFNQKSPLPYCKAVGAKAVKKLVMAHMKGPNRISG